MLSIQGTFDKTRLHPIEVSLIPEEFLPYFALSDTSRGLNSGNSLVIKGQYDVPIPDDKRLKRLALAHMGANIIKLRQALVPDKIEQSMSVPHRVKSLQRRPFYTAQDISLLTGETVIANFPDLLPEVITHEQYIDAIVEANLLMTNLLETNYKGIIAAIGEMENRPHLSNPTS